MVDFPKAVRKAIGTGVPCTRPFTGIELLQLINYDHITRHGCWPINQLHELTNPGNPEETLITYIDAQDQKEHLRSIVASAGKAGVKPLDVTYLKSLKVGVHADMPLTGEDLANVGLELTSDTSWSLSFADGRITKKSVSRRELRRFLDSNKLPWDEDFAIKHAVITAIYYVNGGLKFTGNVKLNTSGGVHVTPTPSVPVDIIVGWKYTVSNTGTLVLSEANADEWIIAIEYNKLVPNKDDKVTLNGPPVNARIASRIADDEAIERNEEVQTT